MSQSKSNKNPQSNPSQTQASFNLGAYLQGLRTEHNISLDELSKHLKIRVSNLEAIENNQSLEHIPTPYFRGYVKNYCMFFGVDPSRVLEHARPNETNITSPKPVYNSSGAFLYSSDSRNSFSRKSIVGNLPLKTILLASSLVFVGIFVYKVVSSKSPAVSQSYVTHSGFDKNRLQQSSSDF
ncbi:MAG: helix-turn-helix domain-containing protein [Pseudomonadota bacterium]|nr:helix-turn-helix domain-containing protein [Pseudomonadota bacterium]